MYLFSAILLQIAQGLWIPRSVEIKTESTVEWRHHSIPCDASGSDSFARTTVRPCDVDEWQDRIIGSYPQDALFRDQEGTVAISGIVDADGHMTGCNVDQSSGHSLLDQAACSKFHRHAKFLPALNGQGETIPKRYETRVVYRLPKWPSELGLEISDPEPRDEEEWAKRIANNAPLTTIRQDLSGVVDLRVMVAPTGRVVRCEVLRSTAPKISQTAACHGMRRYSRFNPAVDPRGRAVIGEYSTTITYQYN